MSVSVIISTYNRPQALTQVLEGMFRQKQLADEIIVADDGSLAATADVVAALRGRSPCPVKHVWQPDQGFRAAMVRNRAVAEATADYLLFLDGDCIPMPEFIERHLLLARPGSFVAGNRVLLNATLTHEVEFNDKQVWRWPVHKWLLARAQGKVNRLLPLLYLSAQYAWRDNKPGQWEGVRTCNLGLWKKDFVKLNGFDEDYQGWGHEDADLAIRLIKAGVYRRDGRFCVPVLHLWHQEHDRSQEMKNRERLQSRLNGVAELIRPIQGVDQYLK